jgi:bacillithiol system protein YtxJ
MSLLKTIFGSGEQNKSDFNWKNLESIEQLDGLLELSINKPVLIFKHSTRCGISRAVLKAFEKKFKDIEAEFYYLDLLQFRELSNELASRFNVIHQSPQLLVIKYKKVVNHNSHYDLLDLKV